jgi:hypothetical protein
MPRVWLGATEIWPAPYIERTTKEGSLMLPAEVVNRFEAAEAEAQAAAEALIEAWRAAGGTWSRDEL